ncbi:hypothetical protein JTE90_017654 [Oedothorax gibbosus]|uniref:EF-hand domain-containing protein n=1 Tax=Oedothorax gibbosus TaxID=931172 RepID=A0AAV6U1H0_9ARAC|nr:hypothetical protein JTE90_017654 [Oedothorax gibbosus]
MGDEDKKEKKKKTKKKTQDADAPQDAEAPQDAKPPQDTEAPQAEEQPPAPEVNDPAPEKKASTKKKAQRSGSNVFAMFTQRKVQEFKEAFQLIDQDKDGFITKSDLRITFDLIGREVEDEDLESMLEEAPGPINFTMFLTIFGERISEEVLKNTLKKRGDRFTDEEADICLNEAPVDKEGYISIRRFTRVLTKGDEDDDTDGG